MIIEKPYDQLKAIKRIMRNISRNLEDMEIIVSNMQDFIVDNLENSVDDLQRKIDKRVIAEDMEAFLYGKEK